MITVFDIKRGNDPFQFSYLPKNQTIRCRILEFENSEGSKDYCYPIALHLRHGRFISYCRRKVFNKESLFCEINEDNNHTKHSKLIDRYLAYGYGMNIKVPPILTLLPKNVRSEIDKDILKRDLMHFAEAEKGLIVEITSQGEGLNTSYEVKITDETYPMDKIWLPRIKDPSLILIDRGYEHQKKILKEMGI